MLQLKVKRGELAKEFELLHIAKDGDVGLDIPVALPYKENYEEDVKEYLMRCREFDNGVDDVILNELKHGCIIISPGERYLVPTDIRIEIPKGYWASIEARSSTSKQSLIVPKGVIDEGYRGELFAQIINVGKNAVVIHHGDRLIQLILHERVVKDFEIIEVDELSKSERGETGFGSSGQSAKIVK
jgi:dUTP pyrophosphatase